MSGTAAIAIGCHHGDLGQIGQRIAQASQAFGPVAIIIAHEYFQGAPIY